MRWGAPDGADGKISSRRYETPILMRRMNSGEIQNFDFSPKTSKIPQNRPHSYPLMWGSTYLCCSPHNTLVLWVFLTPIPECQGLQRWNHSFTSPSVHQACYYCYCCYCRDNGAGPVKLDGYTIVRVRAVDRDRSLGPRSQRYWIQGYAQGPRRANWPRMFRNSCRILEDFC